MPLGLRVLIVEDSSDDYELMLRELRRGGFEPDGMRVSNAAELRAALSDRDWDVVLSDYSMPAFSAPEALALVRASNEDLPLIIVSGSISEDAAVLAMRAGARDFFAKDKIMRLPAAVGRELREAALRRSQRRAAAGRELLGRAGELLVSSLDYEATLAHVARLSVATVAELCIVDLLDDDGRLYRVAWAHRDPEMEPKLHELLHRAPAPEETAEPAVMALDRRETLVMNGLSYPHPAEPTFFRAARLSGCRAAISVPLKSRGTVLGVVNLSSPRAFDAEDVALAEELGRTASMAIHNARLYRNAQTAIETRDEFLAVASHELNTPLTAALLQIQSLRKTAKPGVTVDGRLAGKLNVASESLSRLGKLIEDLLEVSRISGGQLDIQAEDLDVAELVTEVAQRWSDEAEQAGTTILVKGDTTARVSGDRLRLEQVFGNLLSNAIKFASKQPIEITVASGENGTIISVRDRGIGIAAADQRRLFQRFQRAAPRRHYGGMGLGLYISRRIIEAHGGTISVESRLGEGATFTVTLPVAASGAMVAS